MNYSNGTASDITIAYIGGGSKFWAWDLMSDLALEKTMSGTVRLFDIDHDGAKINEKIGNQIYDRKDAPGKWKYVTMKTIDETITGADFVIISIVPGPMSLMEFDVHLPEKYGIYQAVGDTVGPGGILRAMRAIPIYREFARKIRSLCPDAWVINYTNPMTICTKILYEEFPEIKAFGCCHEVFSTQFLLTDVLAHYTGIQDVPRDEIRVNVLGINHFTWLDSAVYKGIDLFPLYREFAKMHVEEGYLDARQRKRDAEEMKYFGCYNMVKFDLCNTYGLIAASGDRHLAEFVPAEYLGPSETVEKWKYALTPLTYRFKRLEDRIAMGKDLLSGKIQFPIKPSGEEGVQQMRALIGISEMVTNVNLPNKGQLEGITEGAVVETNALFTKNRIQPVVAGKLPDPVLKLVMRHVDNQEAIVRGAYSGNTDEILNAFINDPIVNMITPDKARDLFREMTSATKEYLGSYKL